jgi:hypothetical protein
MMGLNLNKAIINSKYYKSKCTEYAESTGQHDTPWSMNCFLWWLRGQLGATTQNHKKVEYLGEDQNSRYSLTENFRTVVKSWKKSYIKLW